MIKIFLLIFLAVAINAQEMTMRQNVLFTVAASGICKNYALKVGGNAEAFSELAVFTIKIADKMGYTKNFQSFVKEVDFVKTVLQKLLSQKYNSKLDVYNDWCIRLYKGFQKGYRRSMK